MGVVGGLADHIVPGYFIGQDPDLPEEEDIHGLDLGSGVFFAPFTANYVPEGEHAGGVVWHTHADGQLCGGAVQFVPSPHRSDGGGPVWQVESWDPLTISPSVLAKSGPPPGTECLHGFIRNGIWEGC